MTDVYWNSRKRLFSLRERGKVIGHTEDAYMYKPKFIVSEKGRQRVLNSGHKNVHAFLRGEVVSVGSKLHPKAQADFWTVNRAYSDYSLAVYQPEDECGLFRILCIIGDYPITEDINKMVNMVKFETYKGKPQVRVKLFEEEWTA